MSSISKRFLAPFVFPLGFVNFISVKGINQLTTLTYTKATRWKTFRIWEGLPLGHAVSIKCAPCMDARGPFSFKDTNTTSIGFEYLEVDMVLFEKIQRMVLVTSCE